MTIAESLLWATQLFIKNNIPEPRAEAERLFCHLTKLSSIDFLTKPKTWLDKKITSSVQIKFKKLIKKRSQHYPFNYLVGFKEFYGRNFIVTPNVLIPRPETEELVELVLTQYKNSANKPKIIADLGTGSSAIATTLFLELKKIANKPLTIFASDISNKALIIAKKNAKKLKASIIFIKSNLLKSYPNTPNWLVANLPYLLPTEVDKKNEDSEASITYEPRLALIGGTNGLKPFEQLFKQIDKKHSDIQKIFLEINPLTYKQLISLAKEILPNYVWEIKKDYSHRNRFLLGNKKSRT